MGDRAQVFIPSAGEADLTRGVYLYTHLDGQLLASIVQAALKRAVKGGRESDVEYLARIVFSEMVRMEVNGTTGYGIGTGRHWDLQHPVIAIAYAHGAHEARVGIETGFNPNDNHSTYAWMPLRMFIELDEAALAAWWS